VRFIDKVCLVSGGGSGIGKATCKQFAREGGKILVIDINEEHCKQTGSFKTRAIAGPALSGPVWKRFGTWQPRGILKRF